MLLVAVVSFRAVKWHRSGVGTGHMHTPAAWSTMFEAHQPRTSASLRRVYVSFLTLLACSCVVHKAAAGSRTYSAKAETIDSNPLLSFLNPRNSAFQQVFNPSYIEAHDGMLGFVRCGMLWRQQDVPLWHRCPGWSAGTHAELHS